MTDVRRLFDELAPLVSSLREDGYQPSDVIAKVLQARKAIGPTAAQIEAGAAALWAEFNGDVPWPPTSDGDHAYGMPGPVLDRVVTAFRLRSELVLQTALDVDVTS